jgi:lipoate-protein ligase A
VVLGRFQKVMNEVNHKLCLQRGISIVRRFSGGGAVYQDLGNLNYSIALESCHPLLDGLDIIDTFKVFSSGLLAGLKILGLNPVFKPEYGLLLNDKKISGNAQSRRKGIIFHHGTLLINSDLALLTKVLNAPKKDVHSNNVLSNKICVTNINPLLAHKINTDEIKKVLEKGFEKTFNIKLVPRKLTVKQKKTAERLYLNKYSKNEWNYSH